MRDQEEVVLSDAELMRIARAVVDATPFAEANQAWWYAAKATAEAIRAHEVRSSESAEHVYVVTTGEYDDYRVARVFRTLALAETYARMNRDANPPFVMPVEDRQAQPLRMGAVRVSIRVHADLDRETNAYGETRACFGWRRMIGWNSTCAVNSIRRNRTRMRGFASRISRATCGPRWTRIGGKTGGTRRKCATG